MKKSFAIQTVFYLAIGFVCSAQFAPQAPLEGHEGIHKSDSRISAWASEVVDFERGYANIEDHSLGLASAGSEANALGPANSTIVSLGDGGSITLKFDQPIYNGNGPDFAVFENAFADPLDRSMAFLELAFVEVSTDGIRFVRFPATSNLQTDSQITNETYSDASKINNLAGKYLANYGTPFDLEELKDSSGIDINEINYVRIIDVIGILNSEHTSYDQYGNMINDPWPTPFSSSGFDLDAVAVLHQQSSGIHESQLFTQLSIFPNPVNHYLCIELKNNPTPYPFEIIDVLGRVQTTGILTQSSIIQTGDWQSGIYFIRIESETYRFIKW